MDARGGTSSDRYAIDRKIASGGMATVYLGRALGAHGFERRVAIKVCHPHLLEGEARVHALVDEARVTARIRHPNVVATLDVVPAAASLHLVMEYVEGVTLAEMLRDATASGERLPLPVVVRTMLDVLAGLHAAHETKDDDGRPLGVVHRDVSPQNVLVSVDGHAKIGDFGISKAEGRLALSTETGEVKGKLGYVAPEAYRGEAVARQADLYATGVVLWECAAGERLFEGDSHASVMQRVLRGGVPPLGFLRDDVPLELDAVIARATATDPRARYASAEDFARALEALPVTPATTRELGAAVRAVKARREATEGPPRAIESVPPFAVETPAARAEAVAALPPKRHSRAWIVLSSLAVAAVAIASAARPARVARAVSARPALPVPLVRVVPAAREPLPPAPLPPASGRRAPSSEPRRSGFYDPKEL